MASTSPCLPVQRELEKILSQFSEIQAQSENELSNSILRLENEILSDGNENNSSNLLNNFSEEIKIIAEKISNSHKELHNQVSKVGKAIDKNFVSDFDAIIADEVFESNNNVLNKVIAEHLLRDGRKEITEVLARESGMTFDDNKHELFIHLHYILEHLKNHNVEPAIEWVKKSKQTFHSSSLEFNLHKLQYIQLIQLGDVKQCLDYARQYLSSFAQANISEFQSLIACLIYVNKGLDKSPYLHFLNSKLWVDVEKLLIKEACSSNGLSFQSPLSIIINAGCKALGPLLEIKNIMHQRKCNEVWSNKDELPVEIDLPLEYRYHSIFACPILKQQTTTINPPLRLKCGHVISKDAVNKLSSSNKSDIKCPYCPIEQKTTDAKEIYF